MKTHKGVHRQKKNWVKENPLYCVYILTNFITKFVVANSSCLVIEDYLQMCSTKIVLLNSSETDVC